MTIYVNVVTLLFKKNSQDKGNEDLVKVILLTVKSFLYPYSLKKHVNHFNPE